MVELGDWVSSIKALGASLAVSLGPDPSFPGHSILGKENPMQVNAAAGEVIGDQLEGFGFM